MREPVVLWFLALYIFSLFFLPEISKTVRNSIDAAVNPLSFLHGMQPPFLVRPYQYPRRFFLSLHQLGMEY